MIQAALPAADPACMADVFKRALGAGMQTPPASAMPLGPLRLLDLAYLDILPHSIGIGLAASRFATSVSVVCAGRLYPSRKPDR